MSILKSTIVTLVVAYLLSAALLFAYQRKFLYAPTPEYAHDLSTFEIESGGETLEIITLNTQKSGALIYFGGNAEAVVLSAQDFSEWLPEHAIYLVNYRGYGGSSGAPSEDGLYADALAIYDHVYKTHGSVSLIGRSLGTGVATYLAANRTVSSVALVTPYDSIRSVAQGHFPIYPMSILLKDKYDSLNRVSQIQAPVLIMTAENDNVIPAEHSSTLFRAFSHEQATMKIIGDADHNTLSNTPEYYIALKNFLANADNTKAPN